MKLLLALTTLVTLAITSVAQDQEIDSSEDEKKVKKAVVNWADSVFHFHEEYKFEHFKAFYTEEYFIAIMRSRAYKERLEDVEKDKKAGKYKGSEDDYKKEHKELHDAWKKVQDQADNMKMRVTHYQIRFWSNIQTTDGITVYYEHIVKLDNNYQVTEATINSAIGKKNEKTEILYSKNVKGEKKKVKQELKDDDKKDVKTTGTPPQSGSVKISGQFEKNEPNPSENKEKQETKKERKARKKAEKKAAKEKRKRAKNSDK